jgi:hypothetical protein
MQFKKSTGLKSISDVAVSSRKGKSPLESIREFRDKNGLEDDLTLYFQLREKSKTASDLQHNILLSYERLPNTRAIYVAPLLLDKTEYQNALFRSADRFLLNPFYYRPSHTLYMKGWISRFGVVPFLREHVSIPPHTNVADHNHYYAYSETGTDISWHSPSIVEREPSRLSDFLVSTLSQVIEDPESMSSIGSLAENVRKVASSIGFNSTDSSNNESAMSCLQSHARWLREFHGIRQFLLLGNSELIAKLRNQG